MPGMTALDALSPEEWAYNTLLRRRSGVQAAPDAAVQQTAYGDPLTPVTTAPTVPTNNPVLPPNAKSLTPGGTAAASGLPGATGTTPVTTRRVTGQVTGDPPETPPTTPPPQAPQSPYGTTPRTDMGSGVGGGYAYTGFDFTQDPNNRLIGKSAKYTFADATREAELAGAGDVWKTKEGAQYFAEKYIKPKFEAAGVEVLDIKGDKMFVRDWDDRAKGRPGRWVDFVVNADGDPSKGENPALAWQVDNSIDAISATERKYDPRADVGDNPYAGSAAPPAPENTTQPEGTPEDRAHTRALLARERKRVSLADLG